MIKRELQAELLRMAQEYPVVTVIGPRQSGKTTLVQATFPQKPYVNLESFEWRQLVDLDPNALLARFPDGAIFDEVQRVPSLLSYIQVQVDLEKRNGLYVLTGSHQPILHKEVTQSLAGRTALLFLLPLSLTELLTISEKQPLDNLLFRGFLPRIYDQHQEPIRAYRNYFQTYVERDVRLLVNIRDLSAFQKFMQLCASRVGQLVNYDDLSRAVGVSNNTIKQWLSILEASFIIVRLQPYYANISKRLIKTPKLYFVEVGLASYLLGIESIQQMERDPLRGQLFENMVVMDLIKTRYNQGLDPRLFFYRDQYHEIDVIYKTGNQLIPIEIKSSQTFTPSFTKGLDYFAQLFPRECARGYVIYAGELSQAIGWRTLLNYQKLAQIMCC